MNNDIVIVTSGRNIYEFKRGKDGLWRFRFKQLVAVTFSSWSHEFNSELEARKYAGVEAS